MKILPNAVELEEVVLGACLLEKQAYNDIANILEPKHFYKTSNQLIYECYKEMHFNNIQIDMLTLVEQLKTKGKLIEVGGVMYVAELTNRVSGSAHIVSHALIIVQKYVQRELIAISHETQSKCYEDKDVFEVSEQLLSQLDNVLKFVDNKPTRSVLEVLETVRKERKENKAVQLYTGFGSMDKLTSGLKSGQLIVLAGRPGMGKTAFALQLAKQIAENENILFFTLEMMSEELIKRLEAQVSGVSAFKIENNLLDRFEEELLNEAQRKIMKLKLHIDDTSALNIQKLKLKAQRVKNKYGLGCIIVDYLQLCTVTNANNREQEVSVISRTLKEISKELKVPVIALSQLSRAVETRTDKRPQLSDLRESGAIEQDADKVLFLYRDKYYKQKEMSKEEAEQIDDVVELICAKNRQGATGKVNFIFTDYLTRFEETEKSIINIKTSIEDETPF
jgi:replicative DNA helicase